MEREGKEGCWQGEVAIERGRGKGRRRRRSQRESVSEETQESRMIIFLYTTQKSMHPHNSNPVQIKHWNQLPLTDIHTYAVMWMH